MGTKEFDENEAVKFIRSFVPEKVSRKYTDDDILLLIDTMYDFYEKGDEQETLYDEGDAGSDDYNINEIVNYVKKSIRKDPDNQIDMDDVEVLVEGEIEYENTLDDGWE